MKTARCTTEILGDLFLGDTITDEYVNKNTVSLSATTGLLDELGIKFNCDKSSVSRSARASDAVGGGHDYLKKYEFFIRHFCRKPSFKLLELGIGPDWNMGASLKVWLNYFKRSDFRASIADINPNAEQFAGDRVNIHVGDLGSEEFLEVLGVKKYDLIVDDASHIWSHQIAGFESLFSSLSDGGVYIVEDIQTSFGDARKKWGVSGTEDAFAYLTKLSNLVVGDGRYHPLQEDSVFGKNIHNIARHVDSVTFIRHSCVICKKGFYK